MVFEQTADALIPELRHHQRTLLTAGAAGLLLSAVGGAFNPTQFFQSYLMAYMFCLGATLGCLALGMVHQLSGGAWGVVLRRPIGAATRVLPIMTVLFLPIVLGMGRPVSVDARGSGRAGRDPPAQARVSEHAVLPRPRRDLFPRVERHLVFPQRLVARTGSDRQHAAVAADADAQRRAASSATA